MSLKNKIERIIYCQLCKLKNYSIFLDECTASLDENGRFEAKVIFHFLLVCLVESVTILIEGFLP